MRFRAGIQNINTFTKLTASLSSLGNVAWLRLDDNDVRFTIIPEQGTQVWAVLAIDTIFETYTIQSAAEANTINLEVPLQNLHKALKSAQNAISASIRLTKKDNVPLLSLTITTSIAAAAAAANNAPTVHLPSSTNPAHIHDDNTENEPDSAYLDDACSPHPPPPSSDRETLITQDIPVRVLAPHHVSGLHEPRSREPDVHIVLPALQQLKAISESFTRLALSSAKTGTSSTTGFRGAGAGAAAGGAKLELAANMHGCLRLRLATDAMTIGSTWTGLVNPELDPGTVEGGEAGVQAHPSTRMRGLGDAEGRSEEGWASVRVDGRDWGRVLGVGRLGGRVIACFCHDHALILYVYLSNEQDGADESVLTYYVSSYSA